MKHINLDNFCSMLGINREQAIEQRRKTQNFDYIGPQYTKRVDTHLIFSAIAISSKFDIKSLFEIGTCAGNSCRVFALSFPQAVIKSLDIRDDSDDTRYAQNQLKEFSNVELCYYSSLNLPNKVHGMYDAIFVDGCHEDPIVLPDTMWGFEHSNQVVVFHDVGKGEPDVMKSLLILDGKIDEEVYIIDSECADADTGVVLKVNV